jgi:hypothetical protein
MLRERSSAQATSTGHEVHVVATATTDLAVEMPADLPQDQSAELRTVLDSMCADGEAILKMRQARTPWYRRIFGILDPLPLRS